MNKNLSWAILAITAGILCAGCSATNLSKIIKAASNDNASWAVDVNTIYGSGHYRRFGKGTMGTMSADGTMTITGQAGTNAPAK